LAGGGLLAAIGYAPTRWLAGSDGVRAMAVALAVVVVVVEAALLATRRRMAAAEAGQRLRIALGGGLVRFVFTLAAALAVIRCTSVPPAAFLVWLAIAYVVIVLVETGILAAWSKRTESQR
jgi:heme exporter protein D